MHDRRRRQLASSIGILFGLAAITATPCRGQTVDSALVRPNLALIFDGSSFSQDSVSAFQVGDVPAVARVRMMRAIATGLVKVPRPWRYRVEIDYQGLMPGSDHAFVIHELNVTIPVGLGVELQVGRQKQGLTQQVMASSRTLPFAEPPAAINAFFPSVSNGARLMGGTARRGRWTLGWFNEEIATAGPMPTGGNEVTANAFYTPQNEDDAARLVQLAAYGRWKEATNGTMRFHSNPETFWAPPFPDTRTFGADDAGTIGAGTLVQRGAVSLTAEALGTRARRPDSSSVDFQGFYIEGSWRPGGESRIYDARNGALSRIRLHEGHSAFELSARASHTDLSDQNVDGGVFERVTGAVSWRNADQLLFMLEYGYATMERGLANGRTKFLTARVQWELR